VNRVAVDAGAAVLIMVHRVKITLLRPSLLVHGVAAPHRRTSRACSHAPKQSVFARNKVCCPDTLRECPAGATPTPECTLFFAFKAGTRHRRNDFVFAAADAAKLWIIGTPIA
jgi:hypothetical protein